MAQTDLIFSHNDHFQCNPSSVPLLHEAKPKEPKKTKNPKKPRSLIEWWPHTYFPARLGFFRFFSFFFSVFSVWLQEFYNSPGHCEVSASLGCLVESFSSRYIQMCLSHWLSRGFVRLGPFPPMAKAPEDMTFEDLEGVVAGYCCRALNVPFVSGAVPLGAWNHVNFPMTDVDEHDGNPAVHYIDVITSHSMEISLDDLALQYKNAIVNKDLDLLNCNILDTTYLTMPLNFTQFNVSAKYELAILQFNVSDKHLVSDDSVDSMYRIFVWQAIHSNAC